MKTVVGDVRPHDRQLHHLMAQRLGRERWYASYPVEIAEVTRRYRHPADAQT